MANIILKMADALQSAADAAKKYADAQNVPVTCRRCRSKNIYIVPKRISLMALGIKNEAVCLDCGKHFKL